MLSIVHHLTMVKAARVGKYLNQLVGSSNGLPTFLCHSRPVILNEVKNPLEADKRQRTQGIASEEILRFTQDDKQYVILNEVKNPKVCETVESSTNLEILRFTQDDRVCERDYRVGHALLAMTERDCHVGHALLAMTKRASRNGGATKKSADPLKVGTHAY